MLSLPATSAKGRAQPLHLALQLRDVDLEARHGLTVLDSLAAILTDELVDLERMRRSLLLQVSEVLLAPLLCSLACCDTLCVCSSALVLEQAREPGGCQLADRACHLERLLLGLEPVVLIAQLHKLRLVREAALVAQR